jgi:hypothetical protein
MSHIYAPATVPHGWRKDMTVGAALVVVVIGVLIAILAQPTIGLIVAAIGIIGLVLALVSTSRARVH